MPTRIALSTLSPDVRTLVEQIALYYKVVAVAIDVNTNETTCGGYVALVHNRVIYDPFDRVTIDMPFEIDRRQQRAILDALRPTVPVSASVAA